MWRLQYKKLYCVPDFEFRNNSVIHAIFANLFLRLIEKIVAFLDKRFVCFLDVLLVL